MPDYKETYNAVMSLPCVQRILRKNDKLRKENKSLRNLIQSLPEFRNQSTCCCSSNRCYTDDTAVPIKLEKTTNTEIKHVNLQVESLDCDSDIEIVVPTADFKENIVYDIIEESSVTTTEEQEEDKNAFECDDCNSKGTDCYEQLGLTKEESLIYMDLGEPDRCEDCFDKWKNTNNATEYLKQTEEEVEESAEEEEEEMEVFEITINGTEYYTTNENDGVIYAVDADGDVGDEIGKFVNKKPVFA